MVINQMRIDDRLIHGQIITQWMRDSRAEMIVVADDKAAGNAMQQTILKLAVPSGIGVKILSLNQAATELNGSDTSKVLLIVRSPSTALQLIKKGVCVENINVGNISNSKSETGRTKLLQYIFVEQNDVDCLKQLAMRGIRLDVRAIPSDISTDAMELFRKNNL